VVTVLKAIVTLHNWLKQSDETNDYMPQLVIDAEMDAELQNSAVTDATLNSSNNYKDWPEQIRDELCTYFNTDGMVNWQYDID